MDTTRGRIPKRISPDNLIDSFIEFNITTDYNASKIERTIVDALTANGLKFRRIPFISPTKGFTNKWLYSDGTVRFFVREDKIGINCVNGYIGWNHYLHYIMIIIKCSIDYAIIDSIEMKYVSKWNELSIFDVIDGNIELKYFPRFNGFTVSFSAQKESDSLPSDAIADVVIKENIVMDEVMCSLIDITVRINCLELQGVDRSEKIFRYLKEVHFAQKDMFFSLLKEDFVNKLNPEW